MTTLPGGCTASLSGVCLQHNSESWTQCRVWLQTRVAGRLEMWGVRRADAVITVSKGLQAWLLHTCSVQAAVLYDKAPAFFSPVTADVVCT
jgi:hypothetical protein